MILIVGGACQGKQAFARTLGHFSEEAVTNGATCSFASAFSNPILHHVNALVVRLRAKGVSPVDFFQKGMEENPRIVLISTLIGGGVVPINRDDREFRESMGRLQCDLAKQAKQVYRVFCGIGQQIKAEEGES